MYVIACEQLHNMYSTWFLLMLFQGYITLQGLKFDQNVIQDLHKKFKVLFYIFY